MRHIGHDGGGGRGGVFPLVERLVVRREHVRQRSDLEAELDQADGTQRPGDSSECEMSRLVLTIAGKLLIVPIYGPAAVIAVNRTNGG